MSTVKAKPAAKTAAKSRAVAAKPAAKAASKPAVKAVAKPASRAAAKPVAKAAAVKPAAKPAVKAAAKPAPKVTRAVKAVKPVKAPVKVSERPAEPPKDKTRKEKLVRDSFTMPEAEYAILGQVKKNCLKAGFEVKKSELLRIGVALISQIDLATLQSVLSALPQLKTGRPKKS